MSDGFVYSIVIPVYGNAESIPQLVYRLAEVADQLDDRLEVVFVIDGSPDDSVERLRHELPHQHFSAQLIEHSRNFGSFAAIRTGMTAARGKYIAVMAADLQEPPELALEFFRVLASDEADVAVGRRVSRDDPISSKAASSVFWKLYRRLIFPEMPEGGVDIFACNNIVAAEILQLRESHSSLIGLLYWVGFRRVEIPYQRRAREHGKSGWSFSKKMRYLLDSVFSFTDLPLSMLVVVGAVGAILTVVAAIVVTVSFLVGSIVEPGYTPLMLVILFSTCTLLVGLGIVGTYVWRGFENTKRRPGAIVMSKWTQDDSSST